MIDHASRHDCPRSKLEAAFVYAFLGAWMLVFGLVLGQALLLFLNSYQGALHQWMEFRR